VSRVGVEWSGVEWNGGETKYICSLIIESIHNI
jgi:hypothetical protein